ncbi:MAG: dTDP-4-dehydrorhamnose reductase, partial [Undibacterium sp.]|nr:dTDP-4-dehydrorhamnose reductase [Undibacterium sp.]
MTAGIRILLTGSTGQVGHALLHSLREFGEVIAVTRAQMDLSRPDEISKVVQEIRPEIIINPAAYTAVDQAELESELAYQINAIAPGVLADNAKRLHIPLIHYSTDYVFDGEKRDQEGNLIAYDENDNCQPVSIYGKSKRSGELAIQASGCQHLILRTSWVYSDFGKNFLLTMLGLANQREQLKVVNDQWGAPTSAVWIAQVTAQLLRQAMAQLLRQAMASATASATASAKVSAPSAWWQENTGIIHTTP